MKERISKSRGLLILFAVIFVMSTLWAFLIPWTWSTIDDPGFVLSLKAATADSNVLFAIWDHIISAAQNEPAWGVFRPAYWVYLATFYLLPVDVAHGLRMAMLLVAIAGPLVYIHRRGASKSVIAFSAVLLGIAAAPLTLGLIFLSLQELSGTALVGLGLMAKRSWVRTLWWVIAAWFKSPFAWLLIGYAVVLWRRGEKKLATLNASLGLLTLALAFLFSRYGSYTAPRSRTGLWQIWDAVYNNTFKILESPMALLLIAVLWWLLWTEGRIKFRSAAIVFGLGWVGYTLQMTQWEVTFYYFGPILFLLGVFFVMTLDNSTEVNKLRIFIGLFLAVLILIVQTGGSLRFGLMVNRSLITAEECLQKVGSGSYALTGEMSSVVTIEGELRIMQNLELRDPMWNGEVKFEDGSGLATNSSDYALVFGGLPVPEGFAPHVLCGSSEASIHERVR